MTLYYDEERDALVENHPDEWTERDEEGRLVFDLSTHQKRSSLRSVVGSMNDAHDEGGD